MTGREVWRKFLPLADATRENQIRELAGRNCPETHTSSKGDVPSGLASPHNDDELVTGDDEAGMFCEIPRTKLEDGIFAEPTKVGVVPAKMFRRHHTFFDDDELFVSVKLPTRVVEVLLDGAEIA